MLHGLSIGFAGAVKILVIQRQLAQLHLPTDGQRRELYRIFQSLLGTLTFALGQQHGGQTVIQRRYHREQFQPLLVEALRTAQLAAFVQQTGQRHLRPGQRPFG